MGSILPTPLEAELLTWSLLYSWLLAALHSAVTAERVGIFWGGAFPSLDGCGISRRQNTQSDFSKTD